MQPLAGDEAFAIETAPVVPDYANIFPLVEPATSDKKKFDVIHSWGNLSPYVLRHAMA